MRETMIYFEKLGQGKRIIAKLHGKEQEMKEVCL